MADVTVERVVYDEIRITLADGDGFYRLQIPAAKQLFKELQRVLYGPTIMP
jgi:hypothetical protein